MSARDELHRLIDTLPQGALDPARGMLERMQIWPPPRPPGQESVEEARRRWKERFQSSMRSGTTGGHGGSGSFSPPGHGHHSSTHWEDQTAVIDSLHYHNGHELKIIEEFRFERGGKALVYIHEVTGPKEVSHRHEMTFDLA